MGSCKPQTARRSSTLLSVPTDISKSVPWLPCVPSACHQLHLDPSPAGLVAFPSPSSGQRDCLVFPGLFQVCVSQVCGVPSAGRMPATLALFVSLCPSPMVSSDGYCSSSTFCVPTGGLHVLTPLIVTEGDRCWRSPGDLEPRNLQLSCNCLLTLIIE
jgi:hypothetical protein